MSTYSVSSKNIASESFDGDVVVVDLGTGKYYSFSDSGSVIWQALLAGISTTSIAKSHPFPAGQLEAFVTNLIDAGLIIPLPDSQPVLLDEIRLNQLRATKEPLGIDVFDDLADLFLADPIHDVEEPQGWPVVKPE